MNLFHWFCLSSRYYEDLKIDHKTGEANLTQIYLQVIVSTLSEVFGTTLWVFSAVACKCEACTATFKASSPLVSRKPLTSLVRSKPANSHSFCIGRLMPLTRLCMPPGSFWARASVGCESLLEPKFPAAPSLLLEGKWSLKQYQSLFTNMHVCWMSVRPQQRIQTGPRMNSHIFSHLKRRPCGSSEESGQALKRKLVG